MKNRNDVINNVFKITIKHSGYFITTFVNTALPILLLPLLTRYLEPSEYANIALFNFYLLLSNSLSGTSIPIVISKYFFDQTKEYVALVIGNSFFIVFVFSLLTSILFGVLSIFFSDLLGLPIFWLVIIPWCSFFFIVFNTALTIIRNQKKVLTYSYHKILNTFINVILSICFVAILLLGWQGRTFGVLISLSLSSVLSFYYLKRQGYLKFNVSISIIRKVLNVFLPLIPNSFQSFIIGQIGIFFMQLYYSKEMLGVYSVGSQVSISIKLLFNTLALSWSPYLYEQLAKGDNANKKTITRFFYAISSLLFLGVLFVIIFRKLIIGFFTSTSYKDASLFVPLFAIGYFFYGLYVFLMPILIKKEQQNLISIISLANVIFLVLINFILIKFFGFMGIAYSFTITYFFMFLSGFIIIQRVYPLPWLNSLFKIK